MTDDDFSIVSQPGSPDYIVEARGEVERGEMTGTALMLRSPARQVVRVLEITGLDSLLTVLPEPPPTKS